MFNQKEVQALMKMAMEVAHMDRELKLINEEVKSRNLKDAMLRLLALSKYQRTIIRDYHIAEAERMKRGEF